MILILCLSPALRVWSRCLFLRGSNVCEEGSNPLPGGSIITMELNPLLNRTPASRFVVEQTQFFDTSLWQPSPSPWRKVMYGHFLQGFKHTLHLSKVKRICGIHNICCLIVEIVWIITKRLINRIHFIWALLSPVGNEKARCTRVVHYFKFQVIFRGATNYVYVTVILCLQTA